MPDIYALTATDGFRNENSINAMVQIVQWACQVCFDDGKVGDSKCKKCDYLTEYLQIWYQ